MQEPSQRITLQKVMQHPWVTRQGAWPLRTMKEMLRSGAGPDDDDDDIENYGQLPDLMSTVNVLDVPRQVLSPLFLAEKSTSWESVHVSEGPLQQGR